jgi:hypothetical protein
MGDLPLIPLFDGNVLTAFQGKIQRGYGSSHIKGNIVLLC